MADETVSDLAVTFVNGAVIRGSCIWCGHADDPRDSQHSETCIVPRLEHALFREAMNQPKPPVSICGNCLLAPVGTEHECGRPFGTPCACVGRHAGEEAR